MLILRGGAGWAATSCLATRGGWPGVNFIYPGLTLSAHGGGYLESKYTASPDTASLSRVNIFSHNRTSSRLSFIVNGVGVAPLEFVIFSYGISNLVLQTFPVGPGQSERKAGISAAGHVLSLQGIFAHFLAGLLDLANGNHVIGGASIDG